MKSGSNHTDKEQEELKRLAPNLFSIEKKEIFMVPADYFAALPEKLQQLTLNSKPEVFEVPANYFEQLPEKISQLVMTDKKETFDIPEGYFDGLAHKIQDRIREQQTVYEPSWEWRPAAKWSLALVTTCLAIYVGSTFFNSTTVQNAQPLSSNELKQTLDKQLNSLDESVLLEQVDMDDVEASQEGNGKENKAEIEDYLIDNNIDVNTIANEL